MQGTGKAETVESLVRTVRAALQAADFDDPAQEARILVCGLLGLSATDVLRRGPDPVRDAEVQAVRNALLRRLSREPVHRILGARDFYGLRLTLSPGTLEPRPDTETLVEAVLPLVRDCVARTGTCRILDLGTGTGAICLALLKEVEQATGTGVDLSPDALSTAAANASHHGLQDRFRTVQSDWFASVDGLYDVIVSNPPYIPSDVIAGLDPEVRLHDPSAALDGGADGLDAYRALAAACGAHLAPGGHVGLEIGYDQKDSVGALFRRAGFVLDRAFEDLGGRDRSLVFSASV